MNDEIGMEIKRRMSTGKYTYKEVARSMGVSETTVKNICANRTHKHLPYIKPVSSAIIQTKRQTPEQRTEFKRRNKAGENYRQIAEGSGFSLSAVQRSVSGITYKERKK